MEERSREGQRDRKRDIEERIRYGKESISEISLRDIPGQERRTYMRFKSMWQPKMPQCLSHIHSYSV